MKKRGFSIERGIRLLIIFLVLACPVYGQVLAASQLTGTGTVARHHQVTLNWQASPSAGITSYGVYRSTTSGSGYVLMGKVLASQLNFTNGSNPDGSQLQEGQTYWYVVVAFAGIQFSPNSNETSQTIPVSPQPASGLTSTVQ